ncbi:MAG TPA: phosphoribosyltransferase [Deltaproteobacteria bacterium]|nr:phosphoribosyltransferase [Deltaproteobacteria bacterium]HPP80001.1 phosphoribosyltransferase [Deltaproteobacteria bacterium]
MASMHEAGRFPKALRLSWNEVEGLLWDMAGSIRRDGYDPEVIIAVARGGLVPARILADYLQKKYLCTFQMGHWHDDATLEDAPRIVFPMPEVDLSDKRVLVVDDVSDEGCTMEGVVAYLRGKVESIRTAVVVSKAQPRLRADYSAMTIDEWRWVFFPWSLHEDLLSFTEQVLNATGGATAEDIVRILGESMSVDIARHEIERVLADMQRSGEVKEDGNRVWTLI